MTDNEIIDALDLGTWQEFRGQACVDALVCPHCGLRSPIDAPSSPRGGVERVTPMLCLCGKTYFVCVTTTPLGYAWQTWDRDPSPPTASKPKGRV